MKNTTFNKYSVLDKTGREIEYKNENSSFPLPISSVGTDYTTAREGHLPYGSALLTDTLDGSGKGTSELNSKGITHIIHAAPESEGNLPNRNDFIENVVTAVQNCILLADRPDIQNQVVKIDKLAICFVGGGIFCNKEDTKPVLAESIIKGALNQIELCQNLKRIIFVSFKGSQDKAYYLEDAWRKVELDNDFSKIIDKKAEIKRGDICNKTVHGANVIVNAANTYVGFGGGISGAIKKQVGDSRAIDRKAKELIKNFYSLITKYNKADKNSENDNYAKISFLVEFLEEWNEAPSKEEGLIAPPEEKFIYFFKLDNNGNFQLDNDDNKKIINISGAHPKLEKYFCLSKGYAISKITVRVADRDKEIFGKNDFLEIEEILKIDDNSKIPLYGLFFINSYYIPKRWLADVNTFRENYHLFSEETILREDDKHILINQAHQEFNKLREQGKLQGGPKNWYLVKFKEKKEIYEIDDWLELIKVEDDSIEWQKNLATILGNDASLIFNHSKIKEWKEQNNFIRVEEVENLLRSVTINDQFLTLIKTKLNKDNLAELVSDKPAADVIKVIKRFEHDNLTPADQKETRNKKMRKHYNLVGENATLDDNQITEYCYKVAVGQIIESQINEESINENENQQVSNNDTLKYLIISVLILLPLALFIIFWKTSRGRTIEKNKQ